MARTPQIDLEPLRETREPSTPAAVLGRTHADSTAVTQQIRLVEQIGKAKAAFEVADGQVFPFVNQCNAHGCITWQFARIRRRAVGRVAQTTASKHAGADPAGSEAISQSTGKRIPLVVIEVNVVIGDIGKLVDAE